ncbi:MAG: hypothetical protein HYR56_05360 [Acidobacteria bacterium]|nr:hypothetical protein [Acidobacteriota bacterium]
MEIEDWSVPECCSIALEHLLHWLLVLTNLQSPMENALQAFSRNSTDKARATAVILYHLSSTRYSL